MYFLRYGIENRLRAVYFQVTKLNLLALTLISNRLPYFFLIIEGDETIRRHSFKNNEDTDGLGDLVDSV